MAVIRVALLGSLDGPVVLLAAPGCKDGEAHRVGPEYPVGLYVLGFLFHDVTSLSVFIARGSTVQVPAGCQDGVRPHPVHPLAHQVDPGVDLNPALCCLVNPGHHVFHPLWLRSLLLNLLSIFFAEKKSAPV
jgi:hypothetical protein